MPRSTWMSWIRGSLCCEPAYSERSIALLDVRKRDLCFRRTKSLYRAGMSAVGLGCVITRWRSWEEPVRRGGMLGNFMPGWPRPTGAGAEDVDYARQVISKD